MNVFLIGMMGSGKSTLGKALARVSGKECVDLDVYLVEKEKMSIPQIFASKGEAYFRQRETFYLEELSKKDNIIVATGGGAPCFANNMKIMNSKGKTIFLDVPENELVIRLSKLKNGRPLLEGKSDEELRLFISETLNKRRFFYEKAQIRLTGPNIQVSDLVESLGN